MRQSPRDALPVGFVGEVEQQLRDTAVNVEQHEAADFLVHPAQPAGQLTQQRECDAGRMLEDALEILAPQDDQRRVLHRDHMGGAWLVVDQRHLAEEISFAEDRENDFAAVLADEDDFYLTLPDDVERITGVVLEEDDGILRSEEHTSELQSQSNLVCRLLLE